MEGYYLRVEAVNLSNFIYDTTDLSTVRGGGLLLLDAINEIEQHVKQQFKDIKFEPISTGASSGLFNFTSDEKPDEVRKTVFKFINQHDQFKHATFVVDVLKSKDFNKAREKLLALNRWQQMQSPMLVFPDNQQQSAKHPVCGIDHVRPSAATRKIPKGDDEPIIISESVYQRHKYGKAQKQKFYHNEIAKLDRKLRTFDVNQLPDFVTDLTELTDDEDDGKNQGNLHGKMAVIYLDGNSFGSLQRGLDEKGLREFDDKIKEYRRKFLHDLLLKITESQDSAWLYGSDEKIRLETLLWGGDELMLVVPAWKGWWTLNCFFKASNKQWYFRDKSLTHAAGLVFCHHNAPIHRIRGLAYQLGDLAKAKKDAQGNEIGREANYVAYEILESFDNAGLDLEGIRQKRCKDINIDSQNLILPGDQLAEILNAMDTVTQAIAKSRVYNIVQALQQASETQEKLIHKAKADLNTPEQKQAFKTLCQFLDEKTTFLHLVELWDYIEAIPS